MPEVGVDKRKYVKGEKQSNLMLREMRNGTCLKEDSSSLSYSVLGMRSGPGTAFSAVRGKDTRLRLKA